MNKKLFTIWNNHLEFVGPLHTASLSINSLRLNTAGTGVQSLASFNFCLTKERYIKGAQRRYFTLNYTKLMQYASIRETNGFYFQNVKHTLMGRLEEDRSVKLVLADLVEPKEEVNQAEIILSPAEYYTTSQLIKQSAKYLSGWHMLSTSNSEMIPKQEIDQPDTILKTFQDM